MKTKIAILGTAVGVILAAGTASATLYSFNFDGSTPGLNSANNVVLPDGNLAGTVNTMTVSGTGNYDIRDVNVYLNISGGYNGDLYGYLVNPNGQMVVLLNRIGQDFTHPFGNNGAGITVTLDDSATGNGDIHGAAFGAVTGAWQADGGATLTGLNGTLGTYANGTWTLFLADLSGGDESLLVSWGLQIDVVPEPATWALLIFGSLLGVFAGGRRLRVPQLV